MKVLGLVPSTTHMHTQIKKEKDTPPGEENCLHYILLTKRFLSRIYKEVPKLSKINNPFKNRKVLGKLSVVECLPSIYEILVMLHTAKINKY